VWYLVLGPTALEDGQSVLAMTVSLAFPVGDLFLLAGLAVVLLGQSPMAVRGPLKLITAALTMGIVADVLYGDGQLHRTYAAGDFTDTLYVLVLSVLVGVRQYLAQRELLRTQAALRDSERVKDEFLSVVGHELRTPLTSIRGSLGLLEGGVLGELPEDAANMVAVAVLNTERLGRLVNDILDIERMAVGSLSLEPTAVDAAELVRQSIQVIQATADAAGVTLRSDVADLTVLADADRIVQALVNLLGNAVKFSDRGGVVTLTVERHRDGVLFSVGDRGRGIPADRLESIFERFRQVDASDARERGGTGLGLPIARGIVEQHGGRMWAESGAGVAGSTLRFALPRAGMDRERRRPRPAQRPVRV
jgi:signal transduction histidine kinase